MAEDWSEFEVEAVITDYFAMLLKELRGEEYNKTAHRRALAKLLDDRSDGSVEFKHQNISAVLIGLGFPYVEGYKPRGNYQQLLADAVRARLVNNREIEPAVAATVEADAEPVDVGDILYRLAQPPAPSSDAGNHRAELSPKKPVVRASIDYLEREARNRSLGRMGEDFALAFEKARLAAAGCIRLSRQVEHVSVTQGDGLGFDILSFEPGGEDRLIEVKTLLCKPQRIERLGIQGCRVSPLPRVHVSEQSSALHAERRAEQRMPPVTDSVRRSSAIGPTEGCHHVTFAR
jgi:hypothetical protein